MFTTAQILTLLLVAVAMALSLAHALEMPGKMRLSKADYSVVQPIYYPGFTWGGAVGDFGGTIAVALLLAFTPNGTAAFLLTALALALMLGMQALFWLWTQPANGFWLRDHKMGRAGTAFFSIGTRGNGPSDWRVLRDQWEYSHVARAILAIGAFTCLAAAIAWY